MKLYVSGAIFGLPKGEARLAFEGVEHDLLDAGYEALNPMTVAEAGNPEIVGQWARFMRGDLAAMLSQCDGVATHGEWRLSPGSSLEVEIATRLDMPVAPYQFWLKLADEAGPIREM
jgi:hypothetical protein